jgi:lysophospholipase
MDPFTNDVVNFQVLSDSSDAMISHSVTKVLIVYTGGTIGMKNTTNGYVPLKGFFVNSLADASRFHDPASFKRHDDKTSLWQLTNR